MVRRGIAAPLQPTDRLVVGFLLLLSAIGVAFSPRVTAWPVLTAANLLACVLVLSLAAARRRRPTRALRMMHAWYPVPLVFLAFKEMHFLIGPVRGERLYDDLLIAADRWLFGTDPTVWMTRWAHPALTELLQIAYTAFYALFVILGVELYRRRSADDFHRFMFTCVYGFFLSYLGYLILPAVGPRFTLHNVGEIDRELPGLLLTPWLRWFVNAGGSVPMEVPVEAAMAAAQRDAFPSGHTMMTLVLLRLAFRMRARTAPLLAAAGTLLIVATVYQRYHYVVDLIAGAAFTVLCLLTVRSVRLLLR